mmetsp:Transcript_17901/g.41072  ORF Transcript_17901/g.41072 Transcript_17901/m.41072 type:complete len:222 (-) Transcript_17901:488-1153(-)
MVHGALDLAALVLQLGLEFFRVGAPFGEEFPEFRQVLHHQQVPLASHVSKGEAGIRCDPDLLDHQIRIAHVVDLAIDPGDAVAGRGSNLVHELVVAVLAEFVEFLGKAALRDLDEHRRFQVQVLGVAGLVENRDGKVVGLAHALVVVPGRGHQIADVVRIRDGPPETLVGPAVPLDSLGNRQIGPIERRSNVAVGKGFVGLGLCPRGLANAGALCLRLCLF